MLLSCKHIIYNMFTVLGSSVVYSANILMPKWLILLSNTLLF